MENSTTTRSLLIVDPDVDYCNIIGSFLYHQQFKVAHSRRSREALFKMRNQIFDLILFDPILKDSNQFLQSLKEFSSVRQKPQLIFATQNLEFNIFDPPPFPIRTILKKPFSLKDLWQALN